MGFYRSSEFKLLLYKGTLSRHLPSKAQSCSPYSGKIPTEVNGNIACVGTIQN